MLLVLGKVHYSPNTGRGGVSGVVRGVGGGVRRGRSEVRKCMILVEVEG